MTWPFDPVGALSDWLRWGAATQEVWMSAMGDARAIARQREARLQALLEAAAARSPVYRTRFADAPAGVAGFARLAPIGKVELMGHFDEWVTDPEIRLDEVLPFIADPQRIGEQYLGRYTVWTSSGSTGSPGVFVQDARALSIYDALSTLRCPAGAMAASPLRSLAAGHRFAMIVALGGHFAGVVSWERLRSANPWVRSLTRSFSVLEPIDSLVDALNAWDPQVIASYPTTLLLLAAEREAGRLRIAPRVAWSGGETLADAERTEIERALGCQVVNGYGASECMQMAFDCGHGALHLNSDWVILEPIDSEGRPTEPGQASASVLMTNLANQVQPLVRYDLGDSITMRPGACACGSPFPMIDVDGRRDDIVVLQTLNGQSVRLVPLALATVIEEGSGVHRFQVIQTGRRALRIRFDPPSGEQPEVVWQRLVACLRAYLSRHGLGHVTIRRDARAPQPDPVSGKLREVLGLRPARSHRAG